MPVNATNINEPSVLNRGFVPLAFEAGLTTLLRSDAGMWGTDIRSLLLKVKESLAVSNPSLADALSIDSLQFYISQGFDEKAQVIMLVAPNYPSFVPHFDSTLDGPRSLTAAQNVDPQKVDITFLEALTNLLAWTDGKIHYEIYFDGVYLTTKTYTWTNGSTWISSVANAGVFMTPGQHTIRLLYLREEADGGMTQSKFSNIATFTAT